MRIGIFGGTFDPVHLGHLRAAEEFAEALDLARVLMVLSAAPPHREAPSTPPEDRLHMLRLAVDDAPRLEASDMELKREGPSYTLDTIRQVRAETGSPFPFLALGMDAFEEIATWHQPAEVLEEAHLVILTRPGYRADLLAPLPEGSPAMYTSGEGMFLHRSGATLRELKVTAMDISSSQVRRLAGGGRSIRYLVPDTVFQYIQQSGIYTRRS
ncbi:MAG: nicotinate-nucleotide adenylyltransferase [bacterium]|nr:MAG: nicotinate-nucleotide adenylyltransferase [bacterium]